MTDVGFWIVVGAWLTSWLECFRLSRENRRLQWELTLARRQLEETP